jgi:hypothetical protein
MSAHPGFRAGLLLWAAAGLLFLAACATPAPAGAPTAQPNYPPPATDQPGPTSPPLEYPPPMAASPTAPPPVTGTAPPASSATPAVIVLLPIIGQSESTPSPAPPAVAPPTETPLPWPEPLQGQTASKLSVHTLNTNDPYVMEFIRRVKPRVVKSVGDVGWLREVKDVSPQTVTVGRLLAEQSEWILAVDPATAGAAYVDLNAGVYASHPFVDYWEGWNEFVPGDAERMRWFAQFEAARACQMQARGWRAAVGGFSTGVPEYALMADFLPALEAAHRCGGLFHLHEYDSPTFECGVAVNVPGLIPGAPAISVPAGPLTLRYRFWYELLLKPRGLGDLPLLISELGIDGVAPSPACDDPGGLGWKAYTDWWTSRGLGPDGPQAYVNVLSWYDAEMRRDPYVLGAAIFTANALDSGGEWHSFDLHPVLVPLAIYAAGQR